MGNATVASTKTSATDVGYISDLDGNSLLLKTSYDMRMGKEEIKLGLSWKLCTAGTHGTRRHYGDCRGRNFPTRSA